MTHHISGFIGPEEKLKVQTKHLVNAKIIPLTQGMAFLPLGDELYDEVCQFDPDRATDTIKLLAKILGKHMLAWIDTDYFGGAGEQNAILWMNGTKKEFRDRCGGNIDAAMKGLGVVCEGDKDEFDTLGLGKHRTNDSWLGKERW